MSELAVRIANAADAPSITRLKNAVIERTSQVTPLPDHRLRLVLKLAPLDGGRRNPERQHE